MYYLNIFFLFFFLLLKTFSVQILCNTFITWPRYWYKILSGLCWFSTLANKPITIRKKPFCSAVLMRSRRSDVEICRTQIIHMNLASINLNISLKQLSLSALIKSTKVSQFNTRLRANIPLILLGWICWCQSDSGFIGVH